MPAQNPLGNGSPAGWTAEEVVLIYWKFNALNQTLWIDQGLSGVCPLPPDIFNFAAAISYGVNHNQLVPADFDLYPYPFLGTDEFAIQRSCYVVYALEQTNTEWQFLYLKEAMTTRPFVGNIYTDLRYVVDNVPGESSQVTANRCRVAYFKALAVTNGSKAEFSLNIQYRSMSQFVIWPIDPAIKNDGHTGLRTHTKKQLPGRPV